MCTNKIFKGTACFRTCQWDIVARWCAVQGRWRMVSHCGTMGNMFSDEMNYVMRLQVIKCLSCLVRMTCKLVPKGFRISCFSFKQCSQIENWIQSYARTHMQHQYYILKQVWSLSEVTFSIITREYSSSVINGAGQPFPSSSIWPN